MYFQILPGIKPSTKRYRNTRYFKYSSGTEINQDVFKYSSYTEYKTCRGGRARVQVWTKVRGYEMQTAERGERKTGSGESGRQAVRGRRGEEGGWMQG